MQEAPPSAPPHPIPRAPAPISATHARPQAVICPWPPVPCLEVRGRPWRLLGAGGADRVGVRGVSGTGGGGGLGAVNHPRMTAGAVS